MIAISDAAYVQLMELSVGTGASPAAMADLAMDAFHRQLVGVDPEDGGPAISTGPFRKLGSDRCAEAVLRQVDPTKFTSLEPFRYVENGATRFNVPPNEATDLASVPPLLTWLVPRYGRHTLPALLHDFLQHLPGVTSEQADRCFRVAMQGTEVPFVRRWLMWAAVMMRTLWNLTKHRTVERVRVVAYAGLFGLSGVVLWPLLAVALLRDWWPLSTVALIAAVALVSPLVLCWVFGRRWRVGLLAGSALLAIAFPTAMVALATLVYLAVEWLVERTQPDPKPVLARNLKNAS